MPVSHCVFLCLLPEHDNRKKERKRESRKQKVSCRAICVFPLSLSLFTHCLSCSLIQKSEFSSIDYEVVRADQDT